MSSAVIIDLRLISPLLTIMHDYCRRASVTVECLWFECPLASDSNLNENAQCIKHLVLLATTFFPPRLC